MVLGISEPVCLAHLLHSSDVEFEIRNQLGQCELDYLHNRKFQTCDTERAPQ